MGNCCSPNPHQGIINDMKAQVKRNWNTSYPRASIQSDGSVRLYSLGKHLIFCSLPPDPFPESIQVGCDMSPKEWSKLIWDIDCASWNKWIELGVLDHDADDTEVLPRLSKEVAAHVKSIALQLLQRGLRIQYHEAELTNVRREKGRIVANMANWLEITPISRMAHFNSAEEHKSLGDSVGSLTDANFTPDFNGVTVHTGPALELAVLQDSSSPPLVFESDNNVPNKKALQLNDLDLSHQSGSANQSPATTALSKLGVCNDCEAAIPVETNGNRARFCSQCAAPLVIA